MANIMFHGNGTVLDAMWSGLPNAAPPPMHCGSVPWSDSSPRYFVMRLAPRE